MNRAKQYLNKLVNKIITETLEDKAKEVAEKIQMGKLNPPPAEFDYVAEGETCEQCGEMKEGETCEQCGTKDEVMEKLYGKQSKIDKNKNGKIDGQDFKILRGEMTEGETCEQCGGGEFYEGECVECGIKKGEMYEFGTVQSDFTGGMEEEVEEGNAFTKMLKNTKKGDKFKLNGKEYTDNSNLDETLYRLVDGEESALFTENEIIDIIENIIKEEKEKDNIKKGVQHKGTSTYEKAHKGSGKENKEYLDSVAKKMTDYIKDGSKGKYETNPKHFPKGNGQLEKMAAKKYTMGDAGKDFLDDFMHPGMEDLVPDEIQYDDKWVDDLIGGSSRTGNNPEWANAEETELGDRIKKKRKDQKYHKAKMTAYRKSKQPVTDGVGENGGDRLEIKLESTNEKQKEKLTEEFQRIQQLMGYTQKTQ
jgi:hypothetical protein